MLPLIVGFAAVLSLGTSRSGLDAIEPYLGRTIERVELAYDGGVQHPLPEEVRRLVEIQAGEPYRPAAIRRSIKQLFALGMFSDIKVHARLAEAAPVGLEPQVVLTFELYPVVEVVRVSAEGLRDRAGELVAASGVQSGAPLDVEQVEKGADSITQALKRRGYLWGRTEPEIRFQDHGAFVVYHVSPGPVARLGEIEISGVAPHVARHVRREAGLEPGRVYERRRVEARLENLTNHWRERGYYRARLELGEQLQPPDSVRLSLNVQLGPRVTVRVEGVELSSRTRDRLLTVTRETSVSADLVEESRANLESHFRDQGYRNARVTVERRSVADGRELLLVFRVATGSRFDVGSIRIEGLQVVKPLELLPLLATRSSRRFRPTPFRARVWSDDLKEVKIYLQRRGFHHAEVKGEIEESDDDRTVDLVLLVEEGPQAFITAIDVEGAAQLPPPDVLRHSQLEAGAPFDPSQVLAARERIANLYRDQGFREAKVVTQTRLDSTEESAVVRFRIEEGSQTLVDQVIFSGLEVTREEAVRREITLSSGEPLSEQALLESRQRLIGTGLFRDIRLDVLPTDPSTLKSDVLITMQEAPRTHFGYGFGYNERELARVEGEITRRNLFGLNRTASLFARLSFRGNRLIGTYRQPTFFGYRVPVFLTAFREDEDRPSFDFIRRGAGLQFSWRRAESHTVFFRYNFERTELTRLDVPAEEIDRRFRNVRIGRVSVSDIVDTRDDPLAPTRGRFTLYDIQYALDILGTRGPFIKALSQSFFFFPLPKNMVAAVALRFGIAQSLRDDRDALVPITERFFAGGANTLRGFGLDLASPKDEAGNPVGGNVLTLVNFELRFPIAGNLHGVVFSDNGAVYRRLRVIELLNWRYNLGFGFRYQTPLGPLRVDWGFKLDRRLTIRDGQEVLEPRGRVHISLGHAF